MHLADIGSYIYKLFDNTVLVVISVVGSFIFRFLFPEQQYVASTMAVLGVILLDLFTKLFALSRQSGGFVKAVKLHVINSGSFGRGTFDKFVVFGVLLIICGLLYRLTVVEEIAFWFAQAFFLLMFLHEMLSIFENLTDAGITWINIFDKLVKRKLNSIVDSGDMGAYSKDDAEKPTESTTETDNSSNADQNTNKL